jgi:hypothetical protein
MRNEAGEPSKTRRPTVLEEGKGRWPSDPFDQQAAGTYKVATPGACTDDGDCWDQPSALVGIDRRLLLGSTVGSCWDRPSAFAGIDRKLQGELC